MPDGLTILVVAARRPVRPPACRAAAARDSSLDAPVDGMSGFTAMASERVVLLQG
jgi:hypothetical protein